MSQSSLEFTTASAAATARLGGAIAPWLDAGDVLLLHGDLGAGKTTLAKSIAAGLGIPAVVSSPSFALINEYEVAAGGAIRTLYHLDLYRLTADDLPSIGYDDLLAATDAVTLIEWPERAANQLPGRYLLIEIWRAGEHRRRIRLSPYPPDSLWLTRLEGLRHRLAGVETHSE